MSRSAWLVLLAVVGGLGILAPEEYTRISTHQSVVNTSVQCSVTDVGVHLQDILRAYRITSDEEYYLVFFTSTLGMRYGSVVRISEGECMGTLVSEYPYTTTEDEYRAQYIATLANNGVPVLDLCLDMEESGGVGEAGQQLQFTGTLHQVYDIYVIWIDYSSHSPIPVQVEDAQGKVLYSTRVAPQELHLPVE